MTLVSQCHQCHSITGNKAISNVKTVDANKEVCVCALADTVRLSHSPSSLLQVSTSCCKLVSAGARAFSRNKTEV